MGGHLGESGHLFSDVSIQVSLGVLSWSDLSVQLVGGLSTYDVIIGLGDDASVISTGSKNVCRFCDIRRVCALRIFEVFGGSLHGSH